MCNSAKYEPSPAFLMAARFLLLSQRLFHVAIHDKRPPSTVSTLSSHDTPIESGRHHRAICAALSVFDAPNPHQLKLTK
jgi:hypothetical protein